MKYLEVRRLMKEEDPHKAHAPDDISPFVLPRCTETVDKLLGVV